MSEDRFTEVTSTTWFGRIGGALKGIIFGIVLFLAAFPLLFWNEGRAVKRYKTLREGAGIVVSVDPGRVDPANEGKLVHLTAMAETSASLTDDLFGIKVAALKLKRIVEMYQWEESSHRESKKKIGGGEETTTTYTYSKQWSDHLIRSADFKRSSGHQNPGAMPYPSVLKVADKITVGAFILSASLVDKINNFELLPIETGTLPQAAVRDKAVLHNDKFYFGKDPASPQIGDARVSFKIAAPTVISLIAEQRRQTFKPYATKAGGTIELLQIGTHTAAAMIHKAEQSNALLTWAIRLGGFILMLLGLLMLFKPLSVFADIVPIFGTIVGAGTGIVSALIAMVLSLITIAVAWLVYRPLWGVLLIAGALVLALALRGKLKSGRAAPPPPPK